MTGGENRENLNYLGKEGAANSFQRSTAKSRVRPWVRQNPLQSKKMIPGKKVGISSNSKRVHFSSLV